MNDQPTIPTQRPPLPTSIVTLGSADQGTTNLEQLRDAIDQLLHQQPVNQLDRAQALFHTYFTGVLASYVDTDVWAYAVAMAEHLTGEAMPAPAGPVDAVAALVPATGVAS